MKRMFFALGVVVGCGGNDNPAQLDAAVDSPMGSIDAAIDSPPTAAFTLTSPVLTEGATIAAPNTCDGVNASPQLAWSGNAMNAMSFAVVLTDKSNDLVHWVIYDIPGTATGLPAAVENVYAPTSVAGAHQTASYQAATRGYLGPCPQPVDGPHTYELAVFGLDVATLPGTSMTTTRAQVLPLITQHKTATTTLTGMYDR